MEETLGSGMVGSGAAMKAKAPLWPSTRPGPMRISVCTVAFLDGGYAISVYGDLRAVRSTKKEVLEYLELYLEEPE